MAAQSHRQYRKSGILVVVRKDNFRVAPSDSWGASPSHSSSIRRSWIKSGAIWVSRGLRVRFVNGAVDVGATLGSPELSPYRFRATHRVAPTDFPGGGAESSRNCRAGGAVPGSVAGGGADSLAAHTINVGATLGWSALSPYRFRASHGVAPTDLPGGLQHHEIVEQERQNLSQSRVEGRIR